ncbi:LPS export ABC transporter periplasmic protein LptC [Novosphingobium huizhouense]|uniref:LPS export ABC transporter periplasmic protein LptC n=1 Tax=Novosphingobium huizhouense TaxID=2866625 RepID=UPI001CD88449|nr:LPS export ABC transporter periplasmic protein LptC [Novosphingobium huizhouense]
MTARADQVRSRRRIFAAPGGVHDRIVRIAARGLPLLIGALLAVMILAPLSPRGEISFLLDRNKVAVVQDRLKVVSAMYRGQDNDGRNFSVTAGNAIQHSAADDVVQMRDVTARVMLDNGPAILTANTGGYNFAHQTIAVDGPVNFQTSDGYRLVTEGSDIDINAKRMVSRGRVDGRIPAGTFTADRISADLEQRTVTLVGNARLRMEPGKMKSPTPR